MVNMGPNHLSESLTELDILITPNVRWNSSLAQVRQKQCDLVTDERYGGVDTSELGDQARHFFLIFAVKHLQIAVQ